MSYVKFNEKNISIEWASQKQDGDGWYEIPEEHDGHNFYKLEGGKVLPIAGDELESFNKNLFTESRKQNVKLTIRDILSATDWLVQRHTEQVSLGGETSLSKVEYESLIQYRAELRTLSNQEFSAEDFDIPTYPLNERYPISSTNNLEYLSNLSSEVFPE